MASERILFGSLILDVRGQNISGYSTHKAMHSKEPTALFAIVSPLAR